MKVLRSTPNDVKLQPICQKTRRVFPYLLHCPCSRPFLITNAALTLGTTIRCSISRLFLTYKTGMMRPTSWVCCEDYIMYEVSVNFPTQCLTVPVKDTEKTFKCFLPKAYNTKI